MRSPDAPLTTSLALFLPFLHFFVLPLNHFEKSLTRSDPIRSHAKRLHKSISFLVFETKKIFLFVFSLLEQCKFECKINFSVKNIVDSVSVEWNFN